MGELSVVEVLWFAVERYHLFAINNRLAFAKRKRLFCQSGGGEHMACNHEVGAFCQQREFLLEI